MKIFKRVYYPIMAVLAVLMLVLSIVDSKVGMAGGKLSSSQINSAYAYAQEVAGVDSEGNTRTHNSYESANQESVRNYIVNTLINAGANQMPAVGSPDVLDDDGNNTVNYFTSSEGGEITKYPSLYTQSATVYKDSQISGESNVAVSREVNNIILSVPGTSDDAILLHARYDGSATGGASDAAAVGALLENAVNTLEAVKGGASYKNTIVFLFGDAGQEGDLGAAAFVNQFAGFDNVASKIRAVADISAGGTGGTLMMYGEKAGSLGLIAKYSRFNGSTFASSALPLLFEKTDYSVSGVFGDYNTLTFTNRGGFNRYATASDVKVNKTLVGQQANALNKFISCYGNSSIANINAKSSAVYFSYLDVMTVYYPVAVAFVIAGIIIGLIIAIIILNIRNKAFSWGKALAGAAVQIVTLLASALALLALYYLFALLLSGFGVVPFRGISSVKFAGTGLFISASILAVVIAIFFYIILKRTFGVKAADVVRGNTLLFALVAFVISFAAPGISYPFTCVALFSLVAMLMTVIFKQKFKNKFATDIERLFLYVWAIVFSLPLFIPLMYVSQTLFPAVSLVLVLSVVIALAGFIAPFADYLKPAIDTVFRKLPERKVRYERTVTEMVEDRAKKGKFTEVTSKKTVIEKEPWTYHNRIGISFVAIIAAVMIILFSSFGTAYSSSALEAPSYYDSIYNDSLLFVYESDGSNSSATVEVHDAIAYNYIRYAVNDLKWNDSKKAYVKDYTATYTNIITKSADEIIGISGNVISVNTFEVDNSQITLTLKGAKGVTSVIFNSGDDNRESEEYKFDEQEEITFRLPYGYENFDMTVEGSYSSVEYEQHVYNTRNFESIEGGDWEKLWNYYGSNGKVSPALKSGIIVKISKTA